MTITVQKVGLPKLRINLQINRKKILTINFILTIKFRTIFLLTYLLTEANLMFSCTIQREEVSLPKRMGENYGLSD